jgi:prepilin-type N-terminal cleavage/methylation domain-containing protein
VVFPGVWFAGYWAVPVRSQPRYLRRRVESGTSTRTGASLSANRVVMDSVVLNNSFPSGRSGFTLIELIVAMAILVVLTGLAVPLARVAIKREKERQLRKDYPVILLSYRRTASAAH